MTLGELAWTGLVDGLSAGLLRNRSGLPGNARLCREWVSHFRGRIESSSRRRAGGGCL